MDEKTRMQIIKEKYPGYYRLMTKEQELSKTIEIDEKYWVRLEVVRRTYQLETMDDTIRKLLDLMEYC